MSEPRVPERRGLRSVFGNTVWVAVWQASNQLPILLTLPFIARAFGPETLGLYAQMLAVGVYTTLVIDFGFNITATREAAGKRDDVHALRTLAGEVLASKVLLSLFAGAVLSVVLAVLDLPAHETLAFAGVVLAAMLTSLTPGWLFLGLEHVRPLALANAAWKALATVLIIWVVERPEDILIVAAVNAAAALAILLQSSWTIRHVLWPLHVPSLAETSRRMQHGSPLFIGNVAVNVYTVSVVLLVNLLLGAAAAGIYAVADRVRQVALGLFGPISQALYPSICRAVLVGETRREGDARIILFRVMVGVAAAISVGLFLAAEPIARLFGGPGFEGAADVILIMSPLPLFVTLSNILITQTMLPNGLTREYLYLTLSGAAFSVIAVVLLAPPLGVAGAATAVMLTEGLIVIASAYIVASRRLAAGILWRAAE